MKWLVIGISGPTCSGKTSLAKKLQENLKDSVFMSQDTYFLAEDNPKHRRVPELNHVNWEILSSLDMERMHSDIMKIIRADITDSAVPSRFLIIEGFLIFNCKPVADLCNKKYFIDIGKETSYDRRRNRIYEPSDVPGYFDKIVWPEYLKHRSELTSNVDLCKTITFLNGTKNLNELYDIIMKEILHCLCCIEQ